MKPQSQPEVIEPSTQAETKGVTPGMDASGETEVVDERSLATPMPPPVVPTPTPIPTVVPKLPVIRLNYGGQVYNGLIGSYCWPKMTPSGIALPLCRDTILQDPSDIILVAAGDTITVEIQSHKQALALTASIFTSVSEPPMQTIKLANDFVALFTPNLPTGTYIIHVSGQWSEGDIYYAFKINVR